MFDLPLDTHRNLIEPISQTPHVKIVLQKRFLSFIDQIRKSKKRLPKLLLNEIKDDIRSTTGKNLRGILLQTDKLNVNQLTVSDSLKLRYHPIEENQKWKLKVIREILSTRSEELNVDGFSSMELEEILCHLCSGWPLPFLPLPVVFLGVLLFPHHTLVHLHKPSICMIIIVEFEI